MGADHLIALAVVTSPDVDDAARRGAANWTAEENDPMERRDVESSSSDVGTPTPPAAAAAAAAVSTTRRHALTSFLLGLRWGFGHSVGLALVCVVFFATKRAADLDAIGDVADKLVGASMILLGAWALYALHRWRKRREREAAHVADDDATGAGDAEIHRRPAAAAVVKGEKGDEAVRPGDLRCVLARIAPVPIPYDPVRVVHADP
jgi:hypothetical protein